MSQYQHDDFSKAYTTALFKNKGAVSLNVKIKNNENLEIDLLFVSNPQSEAWASEDLGLFDSLMKAHPTVVVEHYSDYLQPKHIGRCLTRKDLYVHEEVKTAKKAGEDFVDSQKPFTWIVVYGCSAEILKSFGARRDRKLGKGVYRLATGFRIGIVVVKDLPETPATLWLRGLGKDSVLTKAFDNIRDLPETRRERNAIVEVCVKHFKYLTEKPSLSEEEEDFMKTMQEIDAIYQSEMNRVRLEGEWKGRQEQGYRSVLRQLDRRVGEISINLQEYIKALPLEQLEVLGDDLLDFTRLEDLLAWIEINK